MNVLKGNIDMSERVNKMFTCVVLFGLVVNVMPAGAAQGAKAGQAQIFDIPLPSVLRLPSSVFCPPALPGVSFSKNIL